MAHILKIVFALSVIFSVFYFADNSLEKVEDMSIKDVMYTTYSIEGTKEEIKGNEQRLDVGLDGMERGGFDIDIGFKEALETNPYIKNSKFMLIQSDLQGLEKAQVTFDFYNERIVIPVSIYVYIAPKSEFTFTDILAIPRFAKIIPMTKVELNIQGNIMEYNELGVAEILPVFYNQEASKSFFIALLKNK